MEVCMDDVTTHLMLAHKEPWVALKADDNDSLFDHYPNIGIADWHREKGLS